MSFKPLESVRILDLTSVVVGPVCSERLLQYGAEVIKVESPDGDLMRGLGGQSPTGKHSGTYLHLNRGKRNLCCDLKNPASREIISRLVASADVVIANMRPDALARLGLDAKSVRTRHPEIIYCLITGYGSDGPYSGRPTYDSVIQAATGVTGLTLERDGRAAYVPMVFCDHVVGEIAAGAILAAVLNRKVTGTGSSIEVPMFETMAAFVLQEHLAQHSFDPPVGPPGDRRLLSPHNRPVETADGWISFTINTDQQVRAFLKAVERDEMLADPRFSSVAARARNVNEWFEIRGAPLTSRTTQDWLAIFGSADIAAMPCHSLASLARDTHLTHVGLLEPDEHPTEGTTIAIRSTIRVDNAYSDLPSFAQPQGWETVGILKELGYSDPEVTQLISGKAAISSRP